MKLSNREQVDALMTIANITGIGSQHEVIANFELPNGQHTCSGDTLNITADSVDWTEEQLIIMHNELSRALGMKCKEPAPVRPEPEQSLDEDLFNI